MNYQSKFWEKYFVYYDVLVRVIPYQELFTQIVSHLPNLENSLTLDLGAGTGNLKYFLPQDAKTISLDNSDEALNRLIKKFPESVTVKHSVNELLPFKDNYFDQVVSNNVLYTLRNEEWGFVIKELKRVTKPGAKLIISNLNSDFKAVNIYKDHIKKSIAEFGVIKTCWQLARLAYPTLKIIRFNSVINKSNEAGSYSFLEADEQRLLFEKYGLKSIAPTESVYSNQALLNVFVNTKSE